MANLSHQIHLRIDYLCYYKYVPMAGQSQQDQTYFSWTYVIEISHKKRDQANAASDKILFSWPWKIKLSFIDVRPLHPLLYKIIPNTPHMNYIRVMMSGQISGTAYFLMSFTKYLLIITYQYLLLANLRFLKGHEICLFMKWSSVQSSEELTLRTVYQLQIKICE